MAPKRVIVDLDVGTDDAVALYLLLHADKIGDIKIEAIITTRGNTELGHSTKNVVRLLEIAGRTDIPVYRGSHHHLIRFPRVVNHFHGVDGFGDLAYDKEPDMTIVKDELWISALYRLVKENPKEISLICLAPLTNIAIPIRIYDDFSEDLKEIYIMGGNYTALGNITATSEFNFHCDPEAADIVLQCSKCPITIVPWECCKKSTITFKMRFDVLGNMGGPLWNLITKSEKSVYKSFNLDDNWMPCDAFLVLAFLHPKMAVKEKYNAHVSVELHGQKTRGQVVVDHLNTNESDTVIVQTIDEKFFVEVITNTCAYEQTNK